MSLLFLLEIRPEDRSRVGEKAWNVSRLAAGGFSVPEGFVLPPAARNLTATELEGLVERGLARLGEGPVAVRSSGAAEDMAGASFAGMYETVLEVEGTIPVVEAARRCWAALESDRLVAYARRAGLDAARLDLALLVQRMVPAETAGVLFTVDPTSGDEDRLLIEAAPGLGEALVSGKVTPDRYVLDRYSGAVVSRELAGSTPVLDAGRLEALRDAGRRIQRAFGRPQDVEFAFAGEALHVLQSRPITALTFAERLGEWTTADFRDGGVSARVCTPYMWSLYRYVWGHAMPGYFRDLGLLAPGEEDLEWSRMFFGRPYWNVGAVKTCVARLPGFVERNFDEDLAIEVDYEGPGRTTPVTIGRILSALPVLFRLKRLYREQLAFDGRFVREFDALEASYLETHPDALPWDEQVARYRRLVREDYFRVETNYFRTIYNLSNAKLDAKTSLDRLAKRGIEIHYSTLVAGLDDLRTLEPTRDLYRLAGLVHADPALRARLEGASIDDLVAEYEARRGESGSLWAEVAAYVRRHRYHSRTELDITVPRWDEDPAFVLENLRSTVQGYDPERSPTRLATAQRERFLAERGRVLAALGPLDRWSFQRRLANVRAYTWWREEMRDRSTRTYYLIRRETVALARVLAGKGLLERADDVWFLPWEDVLALAEGGLEPGEARRRVEAAREVHESYRSDEPPGEIGSRYRTSAPAAPEGAESWRGTAASPGRVRGRARILLAIEDAGKLRPGEILIAPFTDPGWTPLLGVAAAVVTETGGLLSHAAVISREYGIPAVLAVKGATRFLADGDDLEVDGTAGLVRRIR